MTSHPSAEDKADLCGLLGDLRTVRDVADLLDVKHSDLTYVLHGLRLPSRYLSFTIKKKSGGTRLIEAPHPTLKRIQRRLASVLSDVYRPRPNVCGFVPGRNVVDGARAHVGKRHLLNVDIEGFFHSIHFGRVLGMLQGRPYEMERDPALVIAQIACHARRLPQGAPSSPVIANMVCARLDGELYRFARRHGCRYTRYADDITFSTNRSPFPAALAEGSGSSTVIAGALREIFESNSFELNADKTRLQHRPQRQQVTGLNIAEKVNVPRPYVQWLRARINAWEKYGLDSASLRYFRSRGGASPESPPASYARLVLGKLAYLQMVRGADDHIFVRLHNRLHELEPDFVKPILEEPAFIRSLSGDERWSAWENWFKPLVHLLSTTVGGSGRHGTAFSYDPTTLVTAAHCLVDDVKVEKATGAADITNRFRTLLREEKDVAVAVGLELKSPVWRRFELRTTDLRPGEELAALGYPQVSRRQPSYGISRGHFRSWSYGYDESWRTALVSIPIVGGLSGGPVIDRDGLLVGIVIENTSERPLRPPGGDGGSGAVASESLPEFEIPAHHVLPSEYLVELLDAGP